MDTNAESSASSLLNESRNQPLASQLQSFNPLVSSQIRIGEGSPILIVEDNEDDVFTLQRALRRLGLANPLEFATDGRQAIEYLGGLGPSGTTTSVPKPLLVLLDLKMPYKDGFQVLEWIRSQPHLANLAVVMLTGSDEPRDVQRAYALGARSYMVKPASVEDIRRILESLESHWQKVGEGPAMPPTSAKTL